MNTVGQVENGAFKKKKIFFSQVSNSALRDKELSLKAKGLYALIQSYVTIEGFTLYKTTLKKQCSEGNKAFESAWKELKDTGYLIQDRKRNKQGTYYYEYELLDESIHTPKKEVVDKGVYGKGDIYTKTDSNNTDINNIEEPIIYITLASDESFLSFYFNEYYRRFGKNHPRVTVGQKEYIEESISELKSYDIEFVTWREEVQEHFNYLPKSNNGNILAFLKTVKRHFGVDLDCAM